MTKRISKRIAQVTIKRMNDDSPDTSHLGTYSNRAESDYAIDRKHSLDCPVNNLNQEALDTINNAMDHLTAHTYGHLTESEIQDATDAQDLLIEKQDELQECDCSGGDIERNEFQYFNPCHENYKGESPADIRKYCQQDYERMENLNRGNWGYVGIRADAEIIVDGVLQDISSGGLWGVESDSDRAYLTEIDGEQLSELRQQLRALGFGTRAISAAFKNVEHGE
jgi:hypothetical protein